MFAVVQFPGSNDDRDMRFAVKSVLGAPAQLVWHKQSELPRDGVAERLRTLYQRAVEVYPNEVFAEPLSTRLASQSPLLGADAVDRLLATLIERTNRDRVRAAAQFNRARMLETSSGSLEARETALVLYAEVAASAGSPGGWA